MRKGRWPLMFIAAPAAVFVWGGWVGLGGLCGFGPVNFLPGIGPGFTLNTAITLPVGVEAYGAYALGAWMGAKDKKARRFAKWSALGALAYGMLGQVTYHLLAAAGYTTAPWPIVVFVSCMPVMVLGFAAALTHLLRAGENVAGERFQGDNVPGSPATQTVSASVSLPSSREIQERRRCSPTTAKKIRDELRLFTRSAESPAGESPQRLAGVSGRDGQPAAVPAAPGGPPPGAPTVAPGGAVSPAGVQLPRLPAGASNGDGRAHG